MSGGYVAPAGGGLGPVIREFEEQARRLREAETASGTSMNSLVDQVQAALADIHDTVVAEVAAVSYTQAQINNLVANPGAIAPTTVSASGAVTAAGDMNVTGPIYSPHGRANPVVNNYVSAWLNVDGRIGATASTRSVKTDLEPLPAELAQALLTVEPLLGRYVWDAPDSPLKVFLIAEDMKAAGFGPDVVPRDPDGEPFTINYSQLVVPLLAIVRDQEARIRALEGR